MSQIKSVYAPVSLEGEREWLVFHADGKERPVRRSSISAVLHRGPRAIDVEEPEPTLIVVDGYPVRVAESVPEVCAALGIPHKTKEEGK